MGNTGRHPLDLLSEIASLWPEHGKTNSLPQRHCCTDPAKPISTPPHSPSEIVCAEVKSGTSSFNLAKMARNGELLNVTAQTVNNVSRHYVNLFETEAVDATACCADTETASTKAVAAIARCF